ncbi:hypothetical protein HPB50_011492 [Hyalomma asiaticum]|uniref:Uncharacterized protein n=1 Tax=Hyalomma asiaticum TaxID=266040 RepID=A0ACB7RTB7_HYAAI|nr:hypothetical protein HPB50_011492 [Hyalomma asiaticum]
MLLPEDELPLPDIGDYVQHLIELVRCCRLFLYRFRSSPITMCCLFSIVLFTATWVLSLVISCVSPKLGPDPPPLQLTSPPWAFWRERTNDANMPRILLWHRDMTPSSNTAERWPSSDVINCSLSVPAAFPALPVKQSVQCEVTDNRVRLEWSDAVVFDAERVSPVDMPAVRTGFQSWVLWARKHVSPLGGTATSRNETRLDVLTCDASHPAVGHAV